MNVKLQLRRPLSLSLLRTSLILGAALAIASISNSDSFILQDIDSPLPLECEFLHHLDRYSRKNTVFREADTTGSRQFGILTATFEQCR